MSAPPSPAPVPLLRAVPASAPPSAEAPPASENDRLAAVAASRPGRNGRASRRLMLSVGAVGVLAIGGAGGLWLSRQPFLHPGPVQQRLVFGPAVQSATPEASVTQTRPVAPPVAAPVLTAPPALTPLPDRSPTQAAGVAATVTAPLPDAKPAIAASAAPTAAPPTPSPEKALLLDLAKRLDAMNTHLDDVEAQLRKQIASAADQTRAEMDTRDAKLGGRLDELQHREDVAEMAAQQRPAAPAAAPRAPKASRPAPAQDAGAAQAHAEPAAHPSPAVHLPRYRIMAGGPDVAVLMDPSGNSIEVKPGSDLGPYGHVTAVSQRGADYVVVTEHGVIR